jgi:hypothetical protein
MATKDTDDRPVVEQLPAGGETVNKDISRQRRKIIRASAAAIPAIMTLRSGAVAAMASTYDCTVRDNKAAMNETTAPDYILEAASDGMLPHDHWVRVPGKRVEANPPGGGNDPVTVYCVETGSGGLPQSPTWQCFYENGDDFDGSLPSGTIDDGDDVALLAFLNFNDYGDDTGENALFYPIKTVQPAPPGYSPLTGSCLASIHPNLNLLGTNNLG